MTPLCGKGSSTISRSPYAVKLAAWFSWLRMLTRSSATPSSSSSQDRFLLVRPIDQAVFRHKARFGHCPQDAPQLEAPSGQNLGRDD